MFKIVGFVGAFALVGMALGGEVTVRPLRMVGEAATLYKVTLRKADLADRIKLGDSYAVAPKGSRLLVMSLAIENQAGYPLHLLPNDIRVDVATDQGARSVARVLSGAQTLAGELKRGGNRSATFIVPVRDGTDGGEVTMRYGNRGEAAWDLSGLVGLEEDNGEDKAPGVGDWHPLGAWDVRVQEAKVVDWESTGSFALGITQSAATVSFELRSGVGPHAVSGNSLLASLILADGTEVAWTGHVLEGPGVAEVTNSRPAKMKILFRIPKGQAIRAVRLTDPESEYRQVTVQL